MPINRRAEISRKTSRKKETRKMPFPFRRCTSFFYLSLLTLSSLIACNTETENQTEGLPDASSADATDDGEVSSMIDSSVQHGCDASSCSVGNKDAATASGGWVRSCSPGRWSEPIVLDSEGIVRGHPSIGIDGQNRVYISYAEYSDESLKLATKSKGTWIKEVVDAEYIGYATSLAVTRSGALHISYHERVGENLRYAHRAVGGAWQLEVVDSWNSVGWSTGIAVAKDGTVRIAYTDHTKEDVLRATKEPEGEWETGGAIGCGNKPCENLAFAIDSTDNTHLIYSDNYGTPYLRHVQEGNETHKSVVDMGGAEPALAIDRKDGLHLVYSWIGRVLYAYKPLGGAWTKATIVDKVATTDEVAIAVDAQDNVYVTFHTLYKDELLFIEKLSGQDWSEPEVLDTEGDVGMFSAVAADNESGLHVAYYDATNADLKYMERCP